jgi:peptidyl-tRNA hydrolase
MWAVSSHVGASKPIKWGGRVTLTPLALKADVESVSAAWLVIDLPADVDAANMIVSVTVGSSDPDRPHRIIGDQPRLVGAQRKVYVQVPPGPHRTDAKVSVLFAPRVVPDAAVQGTVALALDTFVTNYMAPDIVHGAVEQQQLARHTLKMVIVVNKDLKMDKGKIAAQVGHAVSAVTEECIKKNPDLWKTYKRHGCAKVVLRADAAMMAELEAHPSATSVRDAGRTQIAPNSLTAVAFAPSIESGVPALAALKLM